MEGYIAEIRMFAGNFAPKYWAFCQGQVLNIAQNTALFSLVGTFYGGNGQTTFQLPDFRGRVAVGTGTGPGLDTVNLGQVGGVPSVTLTTQQMPSHTHLATGTIQANENGVNTDSPNGSFLGAPSSQIYNTTSSPDVKINGLSVTIQPNGGSQPFSIMQPYLGMNYIICLQGIFPSRN